MSATMVEAMGKKKEGATSKGQPELPDILVEIRASLEWWESEKVAITTENPQAQLPGVKIDREIKKLLTKIRTLVNDDLNSGLSLEEGLIVRLAARANLKKWKADLEQELARRGE